jgi:hypothetical protein
MSSDIGDKPRMYCHWHYVCKQSGPQWAEDEQEFRRWQASWTRYCCVENHYDSAMIWDALQGVAPLAGKPQWCGLVVCRHVPISDSWRWIREGKGHQPNVGEIEQAAANAKRVGPLWTPRDMTPKVIAAREALGIDPFTGGPTWPEPDPVTIEVGV